MARQKYPLALLALAVGAFQTSALRANRTADGTRAGTDGARPAHRRRPPPKRPLPPAPAPSEPPATAPAAAPAAPTAPPAPAPAAANEAAATVFPPPVQRPPAPVRVKPQLITVGMHPAAVDFGAEADLVSSIAGEKPEPQSRRWNYKLRGFFRAPARVGIGPRAGTDEGNQLHSPPRMVGYTSDEWTYIGVAPVTDGSDPTDRAEQARRRHRHHRGQHVLRRGLSAPRPDGRLLASLRHAEGSRCSSEPRAVSPERSARFRNASERRDRTKRAPATTARTSSAARTLRVNRSSSTTISPTTWSSCSSKASARKSSPSRSFR